MDQVGTRDSDQGIILTNQEKIYFFSGEKYVEEASSTEAAVADDQISANNVAFIRKAAEQGDAYARSTLGFMFVKGQGLPQDSVQASYWYSKANHKRVGVAQ
jgi:TPR repeat protein